VVEFLSDAWFDAMTTAGREAAGVPAALDLVVQQVVESDGSTLEWFVEVHDGAVTVERGRHPAPSITFGLDAATAAAIQSGRASAQAAFMSGRLRVAGDVRVLLDQQDALHELDDVFAEVRGATTYPGDGVPVGTGGV
jgi:predicted lipid carrier protein YhbT